MECSQYLFFCALKIIKIPIISENGNRSGSTIQVFEKIKMSANQLKSAHYRILLLVIVIGGGLVTFYYITPSTIAAPSTPLGNRQNLNPMLPQKTLPSEEAVIPVYQMTETMKDPFAALPETRQQETMTNKIIPPSPSPIPAFPPILPSSNKPRSIHQEKIKLTGIVGTEEQRVAIILWKNEKKAYKVDDWIDTYKIVNINNASIDVVSHGVQLIFPLEGTGKQGGTRPEK